MKPTIYVTYKISGNALNKLREHFEVEINDLAEPLSKAELIEKCKGKDAVLSMYNNPIDREFIDQMDQVKIFANYAVGHNNIDSEYAREKGIIVTNTPDVLTDATSDLAIGLILAVARRIPESDRCVREGKFSGWTPTWFLGQQITGKTLGILGAGRIGKAVAEKLKGFNLNVIYHNRKPNKDFESATGGSYVNFDTLLQSSDILSVHLPLSDMTHHIISTDELKRMKESALLINASRGRVVDEQAVIEALQNGWIAGAGIDVYENEPAVSPELLELDNVVLTPHIGSSTQEAREQMTTICVDNIIAVLDGKKAPNQVN
jgi:glyoxylate reductase